METLFYLAAAVAVAGTLMMLTRLNAVHALLYLIVSLLAVAVVFYVIGAPFIAALEVIVYAGAIMVLFVFVIMMLNLGERATEVERTWLRPGMWIGPVILAAILIGEVVYLLARTGEQNSAAGMVEPKQVGIVLFGPYLVGVELASMLLLGALVGAYHLGWRRPEPAGTENRHDVRTDESRVAAGRGLVRAGAARPAGAP
jgi:NADH-quinone oxidoreductase subunit J